MTRNDLRFGFIILTALMVVASAGLMAWSVRGHHNLPDNGWLNSAIFGSLIIGTGIVTGWCVFRYGKRWFPPNCTDLGAAALSFVAYALIWWGSAGYGDYSEGHSGALKLALFIAFTGWIPAVVGWMFGRGLYQSD